MKNESLLKSVLLIVFIGIIQYGFSQKVTRDEALHIAKNLMFEKGGIANCNFKASKESSLKNSKQAFHHTFKLENNRGFVIISGDKRAFPVLGYSLDSINVEDIESPAFKAWMQMYASQIEQASQQNSTHKEVIAKQWNKYQASFSDFNLSRVNEIIRSKFSPSPSNKKSEASSIVGPLLGADGDANSISFHQGGFYNDFTPNESVVGCVATAMSQIMVYHKHPNVGIGYREYTHAGRAYKNDFGTRSANFGATTYNIANLPPNIESSNIDVARLNYHAGVSVLMNYSASISTASSIMAKYAMITNWDYDINAEYRYRSQHSKQGEWEEMIKASIDAGQPLIYRGGDSGGAGGHAWICDGYDVSNNTFHMNWGWGGSYNGFFRLSALDAGSYNFIERQAAIFGLKPNTSSTKNIVWEDFDLDNKSYYMSQGWNTDADGDGRVWSGQKNGYNGSYGKIGNRGRINQWLASPKIRLPYQHNTELSFYAHKEKDNGQRIGIYVSSTGTDVTTDFEYVADVLLTDTFEKYTVDLSAYAGQKIHIGIKAEGDTCNGKSYIYMDDILVAATSNPNMKVKELHKVTEEVNICYGEEYTYPDGITESNITASKSYESIFNSVNGFDSIVTTKIQVDAIDTSLTTNGNMIIANETNAYSYEWIDEEANSPISGETKATFKANKTGKYAVRIRKNSCIDTSSYKAVVVPKTEDNKSVVQAIWPNPTSGPVNILMAEQNNPVKVSVFDMTGKMHSQMDVHNSDNQFEIELPNDSGLYFVRIISDKNTTTRRILRK